MRLLRFLAPAALLVPLLASCGTTPPAPIPLAKFMEAYTGAVCGQMERCTHAAPYLVDQCKAERARSVGDVAAAVAAGRIAYDQDLAGECVAGIAGTSCTSDRFDDATLAACYGALKGRVVTWGACFSYFECASGFCDGTAPCPQTCQPTLGEGDACSLHFGPACDGRKGLLCSGGKCVRPAAEDQPCADNNGCQSGLVCIAGAMGQPNLCKPLHEKGGLCSTDATCAPGLFCNAASDEGGGCEERRYFGEPCGVDADDISAALRGAQCAEGLVCWGAGIKLDGTNVGGRCGYPVAEGKGCEIDSPALQIHISGCQEGLICPAGKCALPPTDGPCAAYGVCRPGEAYCQMDSTCAALLPDGAACTSDIECKGGVCGAAGCAERVQYCPAP